MKDKPILLWPLSGSTFTGLSFISLENMKKCLVETIQVSEALIISEGVVYDAVDIDQAIADRGKKPKRRSK